MKKRDYIYRFLMSFLCASALSIGNLFCLITAFDIPVDAKLIVGVCLSAAFICSLLYVFKRAWIGIVLLSCLAIGIVFWKWIFFRDSFLLALKIVLEQFIAAYKEFSNLRLLIFVPDGTNATFFMAALGSVLALVTAGTVSRGGRLWLLTLVSVLLLLPSMLIIEVMPAVWAFLLLTGTYVLLIITQSRRWAGIAGNHATALMLAIHLAMLIICLAVLIRPAGYVRSEWIEQLRTDFKQKFENYSIFQQDPITGEIEFVSPLSGETLGNFDWNSEISDTDLSNIGPQSKSGSPVMSVYSNDGGVIYLRGNSIVMYEDNSWLALDDAAYEGTNITEGLWVSSFFPRQDIQIKTNRRCSILYLPYKPNALPEGAEIYYDAYALNNGDLTEYAVAFAQDSPSASISDEYEAFVHDVYTQVPDETRGELYEIVAELSNYGGDVIDVVAEYVRASASYSLNTERMPEGEDFVSWFLKDSETGYCVHFATAATVLLRCFDIPARYVNGFMVDAEAGQWMTVTQDNAHAWVEYYVDGYGWQMLEVTPELAESDDETVEIVHEEEVPIQQGIQNDTIGDGTASDEQAQRKIQIPTFVWIVLGVALVLILWRSVVRKIRAVVLRDRDANRRTIKYYRHIAFLSKVSKEPISQSARDVALKARFSQHIVTDEEVALVMTEFYKLCYKLLAYRDPLRYILYHLILAL